VKEKAFELAPKLNGFEDTAVPVVPAFFSFVSEPRLKAGAVVPSCEVAGGVKPVVG